MPDLTPRSRIALALHRVILRSSRTRLHRVWVLAHWVSVRLWAAYLGAGTGQVTSYVRGSFAGPDFLPGLSDVDVVVVLPRDPGRPGAQAARARERWLALRRVLPSTGLVLDYPRIYEQPELDDLAGRSALTYGLGGRGNGRAAYLGAAARPDCIRMLERPGLYGQTAGWLRLSGPGRLSPEPVRDPQVRRVAAWLELVYWWRWAFPVCIDPSGPRTAHLCLKLVCEPARIWLWLAHGERGSDRRQVLDLARRYMPEEEEPLRRALALHGSLHRSPAPPLDEALRMLVRLSERIAALIAAQIKDQGATEVRLTGGDGDDLLLPGGTWPTPAGLPGAGERRLLALCDWRSLVWPGQPDQAFAPLAGDPADPNVLAAAAHDEGPYPALLDHSLLIMPAASRQRARLRAIQCPVTDPVSFALAAGEGVARFPDVAGWSAQDSARRAVAEHGAWLRSGAGREGSRRGVALGMLLSAARAALLLESLETRQPAELAVTVSEAARRLAARSPAAGAAAQDALDAYRAFAVERVQPPRATVSDLRTLVEGLPPYRAGGAGQGAATPPATEPTAAPAGILRQS